MLGSPTKLLGVTVVIPHFGALGLLTRCIDAIRDGGAQPEQIVVVLNGVGGAAADYLRRECPTVKVIENQTNLGFAAAANQGLLACTTELLILLNNDAVVLPGWLEPMVDTMRRDSRTALVQPKLLSLDLTNQFDPGGASGGFLDGYGYPCYRGRVLGSVEEDQAQYDDCVEIFWASGAAILLRRSVVLEAGGFDRDFFMYHEETDLAFRVRRLGYRALVVPRSIVLHAGSASFHSTVPLSRLQLYLMHRNSLVMLAKNCPSDRVAFCFGIRLLLEVVSLPILLLESREHGVQAFMALIWVVTNPSKLVAWRKSWARFRAPRGRDPDPLEVRGIVPLLYYVGGVRKFSELQLRGAPRLDGSAGPSTSRLLKP